jgi:hypothetical protein
MNLRQLSVVLVFLMLFSPFCLNINSASAVTTQTAPDVYVGIDMGYGTDAAGAKQLIDQVSSYTNFFVLGSTALSMNITGLNETLQYAYEKGMHFMSFTPPLGINSSMGIVATNATKEWLDYAKTAWGDNLVGFMYPWEDEPGGHQLDNVTGTGDYKPVNNMTNTSYQDAEQQFHDSRWFLELNQTRDALGYPLFTSDYSLYWFDYEGGYDGLFAEFVWNYSRQINVALCRGAATMQDKQWGVIITYMYTEPPYMESGAQLYDDLIYAYENGAKYIVVLDTNENWTAGALTEEHFDALQRFWQYIQENPRQSSSPQDRVAYQLPEAYAYGFRGPSDRIWGVWEADDTSFLISISVSIMLERYGTKLDIIYNETAPMNASAIYSKVVPWNDPDEVADAWPNFTPWPSPSPTPSSTPTASGTQQATPPPTSQPDTYPQEYIWIAIAGTAALFVVAAALIFRRRIRLAS